MTQKQFIIWVNKRIAGFECSDAVDPMILDARSPVASKLQMDLFFVPRHLATTPEPAGAKNRSRRNADTLGPDAAGG